MIEQITNRFTGIPPDDLSVLTNLALEVAPDPEIKNLHKLETSIRLGTHPEFDKHELSFAQTMIDIQHLMQQDPQSVVSTDVNCSDKIKTAFNKLVSYRPITARHRTLLLAYEELAEQVNNKCPYTFINLTIQEHLFLLHKSVVSIQAVDQLELSQWLFDFTSRLLTQAVDIIKQQPNGVNLPQLGINPTALYYIIQIVRQSGSSLKKPGLSKSLSEATDTIAQHVDSVQADRFDALYQIFSHK